MASPACAPEHAPGIRSPAGAHTESNPELLGHHTGSGYLPRWLATIAAGSRAPGEQRRPRPARVAEPGEPTVIQAFGLPCRRSDLPGGVLITEDLQAARIRDVPAAASTALASAGSLTRGPARRRARTPGRPGGPAARSAAGHLPAALMNDAGRGPAPCTRALTAALAAA